MWKSISCVLLTILCLWCSVSTAFSSEKGAAAGNAIVLATFGTSVSSGLKGILQVKERMQKRFPGTEIRLAFTSNIIRRIWHKRQQDLEYKKKNLSIPNDIYLVKGPLATIADLQDEGYTTIVVQPGHVSLGEEFLDLVSYINGLNAITTVKEKNRPFVKLVISRPLLGTMGPQHPYVDDIKAVAEALYEDVKKASEKGAALLYMGHGNEFFPSSGAYLELVETMKALYPETKVYLATVEGFPSIDRIIREMKNDKVEKVVLKPFMTVAGDHAQNDMAGPDEKSMKSVLIRNGFTVDTVVEGLCEMDALADLFVKYAGETAEENGITLK